MIERIRPVNNPLTIIAIFAALAEVAGTVVLGVVSLEIQKIFVWFVMLFPSALIGLFFWTLNKNRQALYAPKDYHNDTTFRELLYGAAYVELDKANRILSGAGELGPKAQSVEPEGVPPGSAGSAGIAANNEPTSTELLQRTAEIQESHAELKRSIEAAKSAMTLVAGIDDDDQHVAIAKAKIGACLSQFGPAKLINLRKLTGLRSLSLVHLALLELIKEGRVVRVGDDLYADKDWERLAHRAPDRGSSPMSGI